MRSLAFFFMLSVSLPLVAVASDPTEVAASVKPVLVYGIEAYLKQNYTLAIRYMEEVLKLDPDNELAKMYIESSRQRLSEIEVSPELAAPNK